MAEAFPNEMPAGLYIRNYVWSHLGIDYISNLIFRVQLVNFYYDHRSDKYEGTLINPPFETNIHLAKINYDGDSEIKTESAGIPPHSGGLIKYHEAMFDLNDNEAIPINGLRYTEIITKYLGGYVMENGYIILSVREYDDRV